MNFRKNLAKVLYFFSFLPFLVSCNTEEISDRIETTVNNMLPNLYLTLMQLGLFIVVVIVFILLAYKPLKKKLKERQDYIQNNIAEAETKNKEADINLAKAHQILNDSEVESMKILQKAQLDAEAKAEQVQKDLNLYTENQKYQAHKDIELARQRMIKEAKGEILDVALATSKEILKRNVTINDNNNFVDEFIDELNKNPEEKNDN